MQHTNVTLEVLVHGKPVTEYGKDGKVFIEGRKKSEYTIKVTNHSHEKLLAVVTVDGLSIQDGKKASYNSPGMILSGYQSYEFDGWRTSNETTRKFAFSSKNQSYSKKTGQGKSNLGVIGVAVFRETPKVTYRPTWPTPMPFYGVDDLYKITSDSLIGSASGAVLSNKPRTRSIAKGMATASIGTEMGEEQTSVVQEGVFDRQANPFCVMEIYYNEKRKLEQMGINIKKNKVIKCAPKAFPQEFCIEV